MLVWSVGPLQEDACYPSPSGFYGIQRRLIQEPAISSEKGTYIRSEHRPAQISNSIYELPPDSQVVLRMFAKVLAQQDASC